MKKKQEQTVTRGLTVLSLSKLLSRVMGFIYWPLLTIIIGNEGNGIYAAGYQIYVTIYLVTTTGIPIAIAKSISELRAVGKYKDAQAVFKISAILVGILGTIGFLIMFIFENQLATMLKSKDSALSILMLSPTVLFASMAAVFRGYFQGHKNMTPTAVSEVVEQIFNMVFTLTFAFLWIPKGIAWGSAGATVGTTLGAVVSVVYLAFIFVRACSILPEEEKNNRRTRSNRSLIKKILRYAVPISLGSVCTNIGFLVDIMNTKGRLLAAGFDEKQANILFGILSTQYQKLINIPLTISIALGLAIIPALSSLLAQKQYKQLHQKMTEAFRFILMVTIPASLVLAVLGQPIISILFPAHPEGADLLMVGASSLIFISVVQLQTAILQSVGKTYLPPVTMVLGIIVKIGVNYWLIAIPNINIKGAVIGTIVCYCFVMILNGMYIAKYTQWHIRRAVVGKPIVASIVMGFGVYYTYILIDYLLNLVLPKHYIANFIATAFAAVIGVGIYGIVMIYIRGIKKRDIQRLPNAISNKILRLYEKTT